MASALDTWAATRADRRTRRVMRAFSAAHTAVLRGTGGRVGAGWFGGSDVVLPTVRGRRTGTPRTVALMGLRDGEDLFVAASHGGVDHEPQWWRNLLAHPHAEVAVRGERFDVEADQVGAAERPAIWARSVAAYAGFEDYQAKARREIALVRLRRR